MKRRGTKQHAQPGETWGDWTLIRRCGVHVVDGGVVWWARRPATTRPGEINFVVVRHRNKARVAWRVNPRYVITEEEEGAFQSWHCMLKRCYQPTTNGFEAYGARGIRVKPSWRPDFYGSPHRCTGTSEERKLAFEAFISDVGMPPAFGEYNIDRVDPRGNYTPRNVRWLPRELDGPGRRDEDAIQAELDRKGLGGRIYTGEES